MVTRFKFQLRSAITPKSICFFHTQDLCQFYTFCWMMVRFMKTLPVVSILLWYSLTGNAARHSRLKSQNWERIQFNISLSTYFLQLMRHIVKFCKLTSEYLSNLLIVRSPEIFRSICPACVYDYSTNQHAVTDGDDHTSVVPHHQLNVLFRFNWHHVHSVHRSCVPAHHNSKYTNLVFQLTTTVSTPI